MARRSAPTTLEEELCPPSEGTVRQERGDARLLDLEPEPEQPFLRTQKRVPARRAPLPQKTASLLLWVAVALTVLGCCSLAAAAAYRYGEHSWRFRVESSEDIEVTGLENVTKSQVMEVMGGDIGRNIFFVPLAQRKAQLEQVPWVEAASVMRFVPNRLRVEVHERTPIAFARIGPKVWLVDRHGTLMELPSHKKYSFPVIIGMSAGEPPSTRTARMKIYSDLVGQLDSGGSHYSQDLSEIDLSDPDDVKVLANDPRGEVLVHLGSENYLERYKVYVSHVQEWRQQFERLDSVDLRYDRQIIVNPDLGSGTRQPPVSASAAKAAMASSVRPVSLATHQFIGPRPAPVGKPAAGANIASNGRSPGSVVRPAFGTQVVRGPHRKTVARRARTRSRMASKKQASRTSGAAKPVSSRPATHITKIPKPSPAIAKGQENP